MAKSALITGATSGFGREFCKLFAKDGHDLIIVSRDRNALESVKNELEKNYTVKVFPVSVDLGQPEGAEEVELAVKAKGLKVDFLVNNAGIGEHGLFHENDWQKEFHMMQLNMVSLVYLTKLFLPGMLEKKEGRILNLASITSLMPTPKMAVYAATKAFVLSFTESVAHELKDTGVTITALLPGGSDTDFFDRANAEDTRLYQNSSLDDPFEVAKDGYEAMMSGTRRKISGTQNKIQAAISKVVPDQLLAAGMRYFMEEKK